MKVIFCDNGLGDKLIDVIGFKTHCELTSQKYKIVLNDLVKHFDFGSENKYGVDLFNFSGINIEDTYTVDTDKQNPTFFLSQKFNDNISREMCSSGPDRTKHYIVPSYIKVSDNIRYYWVGKDFTPLGIHLNSNKHISLAVINTRFKEVAQQIKPCQEIESLIPSEISNCYGIHLRRSDKIKTDNDYIEKYQDFHRVFMNSECQYNNIISKLKLHIIDILKKESKVTFFVCSESTLR